MHASKRAIYGAFVLLLVLQLASAQSFPLNPAEVKFLETFMQRNLFAAFPDGWDYENLGTMCSGSWTGIECADVGTTTRIVSLYVQLSLPSVETGFPLLLPFFAKLTPTQAPND